MNAQRLEQGGERDREPGSPLEASPLCDEARKSHSCQGCWAIGHPGCPALASGDSPPGCSQAHAQRLCTGMCAQVHTYFPSAPSHARVCVRVCVYVMVAIWQAMLQKPCSTAAAHQNSIEQFRSGSKDCVIITSYG